MKSQELDYLRDTIENEGFSYAFIGYSNFEEIKDEEFHKLRQVYVDAAKSLANYLNVDAS